MKHNLGEVDFFRKFLVIALSLLSSQPAFTLSYDNQQMTFEGSLTDNIGNPISLAGVQLNFYITTTTGCYLYGESSSLSGDSQGHIIHRFGSGAVLSGSPNSFSANLFFGAVTGTTAFAGNNCSATASDTRLARVDYPSQGIAAIIKLGSVPYAQNATTLSGRSAADFVLANADTSTLLTGGTSGQYLTKSTSGLAWTNFTLTAAQISTELGYTPANSATVTSALNSKITSSAISIAQALGYVPAASGSAAAGTLLATNNLSDVASTSLARSNLGLGSLATQNFIDLDSVQTSGTLAAARLPALNGDITTVAGSSTATLANSGVTAGSYTKVSVDQKGRVTSGNALSNSDIVMALGYTPATSGAIAPGTLVAVNNLSDVTSASAAISNLGLGNLATKNSINLTADVFGVLPLANGGSKWLQSGGSIYSAANVGIGTTTPTQTFHIQSLDTAGSAGGFKFSDGVGSISITDADTSAGLFAPAINGNLIGGNPFIIGASTNNDSSGNPAVLVLQAKFAGTNLNFRPLLSVQNNQTSMLTLNHNGNLGLGGTQAMSAITLSGTATRTIAMTRNTSGGGQNLELTAGSAAAGSTNFSGGHLILSAGTATGTGNSAIEFKTAFGSTAGSIDVTPVTRMTITGDGKVGIGTTMPNAALAVNGAIAIGGDGSNTDINCTAAGKQRYNSTHSTMEFCDGTYWQGIAGLTHCPSAGGVIYTLVGKPGSKNAFCIDKNNNATANYFTAVSSCLDRETYLGVRSSLCDQTQLDATCRHYNALGSANASAELPNFGSGVIYWLPAAYDTTGSFSIDYEINITSNTCSLTSILYTRFRSTGTSEYRCCYK